MFFSSIKTAPQERNIRIFLYMYDINNKKKISGKKFLTQNEMKHFCKVFKF